MRMNMKKRRVFVLGEAEVADSIAARIKERFSSQHEYVGFYNGNGMYRLVPTEDVYLEPHTDLRIVYTNIMKALEYTQPHEVYCTCFLPYDVVVDVMLNYRGSTPIEFRFSPVIYEKLMGKLHTNVNGHLLPSVSLMEPNLSKSHKILKRLMDLVLSSTMLLFCLPLFVLVPILIKLTSHGPVFYAQLRAGKNGYPFKLYKFRSMVANAEDVLSRHVDLDHLQEPVFKFREDGRVTWIGKILRRTSIDELPQIFNVLKGDMSWVGPRPEEVRVVKKYNAYYKERLKARPGITGLQQIKCRGVPSMKQRMIYDIYYIQHRSLWMDIKIFFQSIWVVLSQRGAW